MEEIRSFQYSNKAMFLKFFLGLISYLYTQWYFVQPIKWVWVLHLHFLTLISHNGEGKDE